MRLDDAKRIDMKGGYFAVTLVGYCIGLTICEVSAVCVCVYIYVNLCVVVCLCVYVWLCVCVCVCICVYVCVCVCVYCSDLGRI